MSGTNIPQGCCPQQECGVRDTCLWEGIVHCPHQLFTRVPQTTVEQGPVKHLTRVGREMRGRTGKKKMDGKADNVFRRWVREVMLGETLQLCSQSPMSLSGDLNQYLSSSWKPSQMTDVPAYPQPGVGRRLMGNEPPHSPRGAQTRLVFRGLFLTCLSEWVGCGGRYLQRSPPCSGKKQGYL